MEREPALRRQLREYILTEELLQLPAVVGQPEPDHPPLIQQVNQLDTQLKNLDIRMDRVDGRTANQEGREYEEWAASQSHDLLWFALGMERSEVAYIGTTRQGREEMENLANALSQDQTLNRSERQDLFSTDIIVRGTLDGQMTYMTIEASITGGEDDVRRADRRSRLMRRITGAPCRTAIVAEALTPRLATTVLEAEAEFPTIGATAFNNLPHREGESAPTPIQQDVLVLPLAPRE